MFHLTKMKKTQLQFVKDYLLEHGSISRNYCLQQYISRLGARIADLRSEGWQIEGKWKKTERGKDFVYHTVSAPYKRVVYRVPELNKEIVKYVKN